MKRHLAIVAFLLLAATQARAQDVHLDVGPAFLTKSGDLTVGTGSLQSDTGFAIRGRLRVGLGGFSIGAEIQGSSQEYTGTSTATPDSLSATFVGLSAALHPISLAGITPYAEVALGKLFFSDQRILGDEGIKASSYGLGVLIGGGKLGLDVELRLMRETGLRVEGLVTDFKYDPKLFSVMLSIKL